MRYYGHIAIALLAWVSAQAAPVAAQPFGPPPGQRLGQVRPLDQILNDVRRQRPGNLADVQGPNYGPGGDARYRLKWVSPDGRVQWLDTDARTGQVLPSGEPPAYFNPPPSNLAPSGPSYPPPGAFQGPPFGGFPGGPPFGPRGPRRRFR